MVKNEHLVWCYGTDDEGRQVVIIGLTTTGLDYLRERPGMTLTAQPLAGVKFADVSQVVMFHGATKETIKSMIRASGMVVSEAH